MEAHFTSEVQSKPGEMAQQSGCAPSEWVEGAVLDYFK